MRHNYNQNPIQVVDAVNGKIACFATQSDNNEANIDAGVVASFGEEWSKFHNFSKAEIDNIGDMYFDILNEKMINKNTYAIDIGCGTGRWSKYLLDKVGFIEAIDPSKAIFAADRLLGKSENVRLSMASTDNLPFADETFDFGMSIGVLHHIPNTQKAMTDSVKKIKIGGYFYTYLYYSLENKGIFFKFLLSLATALRFVVSRLPAAIKKVVCDIIAVLIYMPFVLVGRFLSAMGLKKFAEALPLSVYQSQTFFIIRNDALDRFGTTLEQRFSRTEIRAMMQNAGLEEIVIADTLPYWHAVGKRVK
jgi:ubiquinone/menaquinone biosynthesis C-methylase UbiE